MDGVWILFWLLFILAVIFTLRSGYFITLASIVIIGFVVFVAMYYDSDYSFWSDPILEEYLYERVYYDIDADIRDSMSRREKRKMRGKIRNLLREDYGGKLTEEQYTRFSRRIRDSMRLINKQDEVVTEGANQVSKADAASASSDQCKVTPVPEGT